MKYKDINYNEFADKYSVHRNASERIINHILETLKGKEISTMLEIGCGTADHLFELKKHFQSRAFGFDRSIEMLNEGNIKNPGLELKKCDIMDRFDYENSLFDFIFSVNVIHYVSDLKHYFSEAYRVMDNGGTVLTVTTSTEEMKKDLQRYFPEFGKDSAKSQLIFEEIGKAMEYAGFKNLKITCTDQPFAVDDKFLLSIENKACAWTKMLSNECFESGLRRMREDSDNGDCIFNEHYVYIWGNK
jgi:ubiquinone/menaquinone biosynthesis C-methylase UbiE